jgi:hypothetical protein
MMMAGMKITMGWVGRVKKDSSFGRRHVRPPLHRVPEQGRRLATASKTSQRVHLQCVLAASASRAARARRSL